MTLCAANERVQSNVCVACIGGARNAAADDASKSDTDCECAANEYVKSEKCLACPAGTTNAAGDNPLGGDTSCACRTNSDGTLVKPGGSEAVWDVSCVTSMMEMFYGESAPDADLNDWTTSKVTIMTAMFQGVWFNGDMADWDVSKVTNIARMFSGSKGMNGDISAWDVSQVTSMERTFSETSSFRISLESPLE